MPEIPQDYVDNMPEIYKKIFSAFWMFNPTRKQGHGISANSIFSVVSDKYTLGEVLVACDSMADNGVLEKKNGNFYHPTELGEEILLAVTGKAPVEVPPFQLPPTPSGA